MGGSGGEEFLQAQARDLALFFSGDLAFGARIVGEAGARACENFFR
jgi:hypothetical protein